MGSGASSTKPSSTTGASPSKPASSRKASQVVCNRCAKPVGSSTHRIGDRPLCKKCGELRQNRELYVCIVCDEIHRYSQPGVTRTRICPSCESQTRSPSKPCSHCGEIRKIGEAPAARGRCAACWLRGGTGPMILLEDEDTDPFASPAPSTASPSPASSSPGASVSTAAPPSPVSSISGPISTATAPASLNYRSSPALTSSTGAQSTPVGSYRRGEPHLKPPVVAKPQDNISVVAAVTMSLPVVGGARGLLAARSSTSSLGSLKSLTLSSTKVARNKAQPASTSLGPSDEKRALFRRRHRAARPMPPSSSRTRPSETLLPRLVTPPQTPKTTPPATPSQRKPDESSKGCAAPKTGHLSETVLHLDRRQDPTASDPLAAFMNHNENHENYHLGTVGLDRYYRDKLLSRRGGNHMRDFMTWQRIRIGLAYSADNA